MEFLHSYLRRHLAGKPLVASRTVVRFLRLTLNKMLSFAFLFIELSNCFTVVTGRRLVKRQIQRTETTTFVHFNRTCKSMVDDKGQLRLGDLINCNGEWAVNCKFKDGLCFYFVKCNLHSVPRFYWNCTQVHKRSAIPICCDLACPDR